jgi:hypothetical protein
MYTPMSLPPQVMEATWRASFTRTSFLLVRHAAIILQSWCRGCWSRRVLVGAVHVTIVRGSGLRGVVTPMVRVALTVNGARMSNTVSGRAARGGKEPEWDGVPGSGALDLPYSIDRVPLGEYREGE